MAKVSDGVNRAKKILREGGDASDILKALGDLNLSRAEIDNVFGQVNLRTPVGGGAGAGSFKVIKKADTGSGARRPSSVDPGAQRQKVDPDDMAPPDKVDNLKNAATDSDKSKVFKELPKNQRADALKQIDPKDAGKLLDDMPVDDAADALKRMDTDSAAKAAGNMDPKKAAKAFDKLEPEDVVMLSRKIEPDDVSGNILKNMDKNKFEAALKKASDIDKVDMARKVGRLNVNTLMLGGMGLFAALMYMEENKKAVKAAENVKKCENKCLPKNWSEYEYGNLEVSDLQYTTLDELKVDEPNATEKTHPTCNANIGDGCSKFCSDKCNEQYGYKPPGSAIPAALYNTGVNGIADLYNNTLGGVFGKLGKVGKQIFFWGLIIGVIILFIFIIRMFNKKN